ncbi:hypothetical protein CDAR_69801 [Caerostris darwini]|uniref:Uncharacterized protein n=1 Tax=Caerostris darwini TaxID=1538125 RepID=A0AAV4U0S1_9ARAC|nr:hypothetical protein CDAR_69801 [Caerostris darwini]
MIAGVKGRLEGSCRRGYSTPGRKRKQESLSGGVERTRVPLPSSFPGQGHRHTLFARGGLFRILARPVFGCLGMLFLRGHHDEIDPSTFWTARVSGP